MKTIIFDTETTDLLKPVKTNLIYQPCLTEIFCLLIDDEYHQLDTFHRLVNPEIPIPQYITRLTGIDDYMVADAPTYKEIHKKLSKFLKKADRIVAHNLMFDLRILEIQAKKIKKKLRFPKIKFCTVENSMWVKGYRLKNSELYKIATGEKEIEGAHRAERDVRATAKSFKWLLEKLNQKR